MECWYQNGHVEAGGRRYSWFAVFSREAHERGPGAGERSYGHSLTWALIDVDGRVDHFVSRVDASAPAEGLKRIRRGLASKDPRLDRAIREIFERGNVPAPDRLFEGRVSVRSDCLHLSYGGNLFLRNDDGSYRLELRDRRQGIGVALTLEPRKPAVRFGDDGVVRGLYDEATFSYFLPRCRVSGTLIHRGIAHPIVAGEAWYEHEFGVDPEEQGFDDHAEARLDRQEELRARHYHRQVAWDWLSAQLDDGTELCVYDEFYPNLGKSAGQWAVHVGRDGRPAVYKGRALEPVGSRWRSTQTFFQYPVAWRVRIREAQIDLSVTASFEDQEVVTLVPKPSFWEGRVEVEGTIRGAKVRGPGFVELTGKATYEDLDGLFKEVSKVVRQSVERVLPMHPTPEQAGALLGKSGDGPCIEGLDVEQYARAHIHPIREIADRGGKGWRSYAAIACCDVVGGDSRKFVDLIALPELMHVGSLIVDDVEDRSTTRRGGKAAHLLYGEPQAINSGTAAYFIGVNLLDSDLLSDADLVRIYKQYFEALRVGHAGQAIDLDGFAWMMDGVVATGESAELEARVLTLHRLKTAAPAGCLARIGAIAGGGSPAQVEALGRFFEDLGLAFQIIDDVLNLRGFQGGLKEKGEDIQQGKVTLPVCKAMGRLETKRRRWLWDSLKAMPVDEPLIEEIIRTLEASGAIEDCVRQARELVEQGWRRLEPHVEDSLPKMLLRAFGWYVLERHY